MIPKGILTNSSIVPTAVVVVVVVMKPRELKDNLAPRPLPPKDTRVCKQMVRFVMFTLFACLLFAN